MDRRKKFSQRLSELRIEKGVSSRDMSLSLGLSPAYINNIENNVSMPHDFFDFERRPSQALLELFRKEESLTQMQVELIIMKKMQRNPRFRFAHFCLRFFRKYKRSKPKLASTYCDRYHDRQPCSFEPP